MINPKFEALNSKQIKNSIKFQVFIFHFEFRYEGLRFIDHGGLRWH